MSVDAVDHAVIAVSDWERSKRFYADVLGAELIERPDGGAHFRFGETQLNVHGPGGAPRRSPACRYSRAAPTSASAGPGQPMTRPRTSRRTASRSRRDR